MKLSVIITTYNRANLLEQLLNDLSAQFVMLSPSEEMEIETFIVDNNSTDNTSSVVYKFIEDNRLRIKYISEEQQGISAARNAAIKEAKGSLLAFIHDDVSLDEDWLREVFKIADTCIDHEIGIYGGRSIPLWEDTLPEWLNIEAPSAIAQEAFSGHSYGDEEKFYPFESEFGSAKFPSGVNFLVRREIFNNCGDFRTDLGANAAGGFGTHDDYEFFEYLSTINVPMLYVPQCIVFHPVSPDTLTMQNIRKWYFKAGRSLYWIAHTDRLKRKAPEFVGLSEDEKSFFPEFSKKYINSVPIYLNLKIIFLLFEIIYSLILFDKKKVNYLSFELSKILGAINAAELISQKTRSKKFSFKDRIKKKTIDLDDEALKESPAEQDDEKASVEVD